MRNPLLPVAKPVLIVTALATVMWVSAGDLNPPPGPIGPTQRTPIGDNTTPGDATAVFKIILPGSYYLTGNVKGVNGKHGIMIDASGVTLDLMGFSVEGVAGSLEGIHAINPVNNIAVTNGSVRNWNGGISLGIATNSRLADLRVSENVTIGISPGVNAVVTGCVAYLNGGAGIFINSGSMSGCAALSNTGTGLVGLGASTITNCSSRNNGEGMALLDGNTVTNCAIVDNNGDGIDASEFNTITNCSIVGNTLDGIRVFSDNIVRGNVCQGNGNGGDGAGIHVEGTDNRIDANNSTDADRGIDVDFAANFITRNTCSGNTTNWDVVAANNILVVLVVDAPAVLGNSGGVSPGSTDPNANYSY